MENVESAVKKNTTDINALTIQVTRIATIVENSEKRHVEDATTMKEALSGINKLNDRIAVTMGMEKDIISLKEVAADLKADIRVNKHDLGNVMNAQIGLVQLKDTINILYSKVESLESLKERFYGGSIVLGKGTQFLWGIGGIFLTLIAVWLKFYLFHKD